MLSIAAHRSIILFTVITVAFIDSVFRNYISIASVKCPLVAISLMTWIIDYFILHCIITTSVL